MGREKKKKKLPKNIEKIWKVHHFQKQYLHAKIESIVISPSVIVIFSSFKNKFIVISNNDIIP